MTTPSRSADAAPESATRPPSPPPAAEPTTLDRAPLLSATAALAPDAGTLVEAPPVVSVPGYELLSELGRGGMGVVYRARQVKADRVVALKMILAGGHAGAAELARFRTEAEAIARLQHPNIVQVYEVGEHEGGPFFSLEFCGGGSLKEKLSGTPLPAREAAQLIETLARAMQVAHDHQIIHRDLKPANVLLTEGGTPKVTDFGLAKKLDEAGQTHAGAILGTPSYMAPEQAGGQTSDIGPLADVYALGAILYECLTGRPPFRAATALDTLRQVLEDEPVPPTQLQSKTPRDLETICLRCLQKELRKRYGSAQELADDLRRFLNHEPIRARPVGRAERARKWVKRNPALAAMTATVALILLTATAVSTGFGLDARRQRNDLAAANETLTRTAGDLKRSRDDLQRTADDLQSARDDLETTLARSLLRPLTSQGIAQPKSQPEWEALWELAANRRGRLGYRFVEEASRTPATSRQLRDRAPVALPAAVGLDERRRAEVEALLLSRMDDPALGDEQKTDLALAASRWDGLTSSGAARTARQLTRAMRDTKDPLALSALAEGLSAVAARLESEDATPAAATLAQALKDTKDVIALQRLAEGLTAVAARMKAADAATTLLQVLEDAKDLYHLVELARRLAVVAARMKAADAAQAADILLKAMATKEPKNSYVWRALAEGLSAVAARLEAEDAARAAAALVQAMKDTKDVSAFQALAEGLAAVAARLEAEDAARAATNLLQTMKGAKNPYALTALAEGLSAVAARQKAEDGTTVAAQAAAPLLQAIKDAKDPAALQALAEGLTAVAARMKAEDAAAAAGQAAATFLQAMKDAKPGGDLRALARGLAAVAARMKAEDAAAAAGQAAAALLQARKAPYTFPLPWLAEGLAAVAARMKAEDAAAAAGQAAAALVQAMKNAKRLDSSNSLAEGLSAVATYLGAEDAARAAATLVEAIKATQDPSTLEQLARGLSAVAARMKAADAAAAAGQAAAALLQARKDAKHSYVQRAQLAAGLAAVSAGMGGKDDATALLEVMNDALNPKTVEQLARGLSAALSAVPPAEIPARSAIAASPVACPAGTGDPLAALTLLLPAAEPPPCRLSTQQLVELLKMPTCIGEARRVILDQLGNRYRRPFADVWQFVHYAEEQKLGLDFASPPRKPEPAVALPPR